MPRPLVAPPAPEATFSVLNDRSFLVVWTAPSPTNGVLTQYFVVITNVRTGYRRTFTKQSTDFDLSVTIDNLSEYIVMHVRIVWLPTTGHVRIVWWEGFNIILDPVVSRL